MSKTRVRNTELIQPGKAAGESYVNANFNFREKVGAKLKLNPAAPLDQGVETDEQLWSLIKK